MYEWKVRELANAVLLALVQREKKLLAPHLNSIIVSWFYGRFDTYSEVGKVAESAFQVVLFLFMILGLFFY